MTTFTIRGGPHLHARGVQGVWDGFDLRYEVMNANDIFSAMLKTRPFEVCEFSLANFLTLKAAGEDWLCALPVFPNRAFRHATLTVRRDSPLTSPAQLAGLKIGVEDYSMSAAVWVRGLLEDTYGVLPGDVTWVTARDQRFPLPQGATVAFDDAHLETLLEEKRVDAIIGMNLLDSRHPPAARRFRPLLGDPMGAETAYFGKTGIFPINHCVAIRRDVAEAHPRLADAVFRAYTAAKEAAYRAQPDASRPPWALCVPHPAFATTRDDPLPYGLGPGNRKVIDTLSGYLVRQRFIAAAPPVDSLFIPLPA